MQDIRIRIGTVALLCGAAFVSLYGAVAAFIWWLIFTPRFKSIRFIRPLIAMLVMIGIISLILQFITGSGLSYAVRMTVIILIGTWLAGEYRSGELLNLGVWLFGGGIGFELGLLGEMGMQSLELLLNDLDRIRLAFALKGTSVGIKRIVPAGMLLTYTGIARAKENAELLAVRGYRYGGTLMPVFAPTKLDMIAGLCAIPAVLIAFFPFVNFLYFDSDLLRGLL